MTERKDMPRFSKRSDYPTKDVYGQVIRLTHDRNLMIRTEYGLDVFCNSNDAEAKTVGIKRLNYGDIVRFDIEEYDGMQCAKNVRIVKPVSRSKHVVIGEEHVKLAWINDFGLVSGNEALSEIGASPEEVRTHGYEPDDFKYMFINYGGDIKVRIFEAHERTKHLNLGDSKVDNVEAEYNKLKKIFDDFGRDYMLFSYK